MKTKAKKVKSVKSILVVSEVTPFREMQSGNYEGCHVQWCVESFIQLLERKVIPAGNVVHDFFLRNSCKCAPHNVPSYIQNHGQKSIH